MKSILLIVSILLVFQSADCQELKMKKVKSPAYTEIFQVDKKTSQRHGLYQKIEKGSNDTLVIGKFVNNMPSGIWTYFDEKNRPFLKFDQDKDSCVWYSEIINRKDSFLLKVGKSFRLLSPELPPVFIGAENDFRRQLEQQIPIPKLTNPEENETYLFSFVINIRGQISQITDLRGSSDQFKAEVHQILENPELKWFPAKINGYPFESQFYLSLNVGSSSPETKKHFLPFVIDIDIPTSAVAASRRKVSLGYAIIEVSPEELAKQKQSGSVRYYPGKTF